MKQTVVGNVEMLLVKIIESKQQFFLISKKSDYRPLQILDFSFDFRPNVSLIPEKSWDGFDKITSLLGDKPD